MKYAVVGAGAMGLRYGILLQENAGVPVDFVEPTNFSLERIRTQGNQVWKSRNHEDRHLIPVNIYSPEEYDGNPDVWIFFMKQMQLPDTVKRLAPKFKSHQTALGAMNGMGHIEVLQQYFDDEHIIGGTAMIATILNDYGDVDFMGVEGGGTSNYVNLTEADSEVLDKLMIDFKAANLNPVKSNNFMGTLLTKVFFNSVENSIATMFNARMGELMSYDGFLSHVARPLIDEAYNAAAAAGYHLLESREDMLEQVKYMSTSGSPLHYPSMSQDFSNGRTTEVDYINGWIAKLARQHGQVAKNQEMITHLVHLAESMRQFHVE